MSGLHLFKKSVHACGVVLDVGSMSVAAGLYVTNPRGDVNLLYATRERIHFQKKLTGEALFSAMCTALDTTLLHLEKYGMERSMREGGKSYVVDTVSVTLSSPWHASEMKTLKKRLEKETVITEAIVNELITDEEQSFERRLTAKEAELLHQPAPLERKIIEMSLNGYPSGNPYGKRASTLEVKVFESMSSSLLIKKIKRSVGKYFPVEAVVFHSFSMTAFASIRDQFPHIDNFLIVQVDGEITDITIVKKGVVAEMVSFPFGHNNIVRALSVVCDNYPNCTLEGLLSLHTSKVINSRDKKRVDEAVSNAKKEWLDKFNSAIASFSEQMFLPKTVFIFEDIPHTSLFEEFLKKAESSQFTITAEPFTVLKLFNQSPSLAKPDSNDHDTTVLTMEAHFANSCSRKP
ncbi:MAG: hypothetical protein NUV54_02305 [Candidatus Taylorbacteria bacterium]|nr:hypothetical protein [Candidatus Taylorbacteria bacterium]